MLREIKLKSFAKINIGLYVKGKRDDGYHNLHSFFQEISLHDVITIKLNPTHNDIVITSNWADIPFDHRNTVFVAAQLLKNKISNGIEIHLKKSIPQKAGLGGGSSNGATVLKGLNQLANLKIPTSELMQLALKIGSDVPFFITGKQAEIRGRGEYIKSLHFSFPYKICLLKTIDFSFSSADIYQEYKPFISNSILNSTLDDYLANPSKEKLTMLRNDLEKTIRTPIISNIKRKLKSEGAFYTAMTGSGSAVFGLFEDTPKSKIEFENCESYICDAIL